MKLDQQQQAETLYLKTNLTKSEIAEIVGVSRRTVHYWAGDNEWERLKKSGQNIPSLAVENLWLILTRLEEEILSPARAFKTATPQEVKMLNSLGANIRRLSNRSALNETIELRDHFMEFVNHKNPAMALEVQDLIDAFIKTRAKTQPHQFLAGKIDDLGCIPQKEEDVKEIQLDIADRMDWYDNPPKPEDYQPLEIPITEEPISNERSKSSKPTTKEPNPGQGSIATPSPLGDGRGEALHLLKNKTLNRAQRRALERSQSKQNIKSKTPQS